MSDFESDVPNIPDHTLAQKQHLLPHVSAEEQKTLVMEILAAVSAHNMAPYYKHLTSELPQFFPYDDVKYTELARANDVRLAELRKAVADAEADDEPDLDLTAALTSLAEYYATIVDRSNATDTYQRVMLHTQNMGAKIDVLLALARVDFFFSDYARVAKHLAEVEALIEKGGDWERRNRHKTYQGIYYMATRNFADAARLLIDSLATFTSTELCTYEQVAQYAIVCGLLSLDRVNLKAKIVDLPEILAIYSSAKTLEPLISLTNALYTCQYSCLFQHLLDTNDRCFKRDKHLRAHASYFMREFRCKTYAQLLESYKSLSLKFMARSFNVSEDFLDEDLCRFIPSGKINCTIDKISGVIETNRPNNKNSQYHLLLKLGDALLTKLQKYGVAVKMSGTDRVS